MRRAPTVDHFHAVNLHELRSSIWRYKWSTALILCVLTPLLLAGVWLIPPKYASEAQLLVRLGRGSVSMDPTTGMTRTVSVQESRLAQVNSVRELLTSRAMAERVVKRVGAAKILEPHSALEETIENWKKQILGRKRPTAQGDLTAQQVESQLHLEEACEKLIEAFDHSAAKDAYTVNLRVTTGSPFLSREIMDAYVHEYQDYHIKAFQSSGSLEFFADQSQQARLRALHAQEKLQVEKTDRGIIELASAKTSLRETISVIERDLLKTDSEIAAAYSEITQLREELAAMPRQVESEVLRGIPKQAGTGMRQSLYALEVEYKELASKLKPDHPKLNAIEEQLAESRKIALSEIGDEPQTLEAINPIFQQLELAYRTTLATHSGLSAKRQSLEKQLQDLGKQLVELNHAEVELTQLGWDAALSETEYLQAEKSHIEARQIASLDQQKMNEISVAQDATLELKKAAPQRTTLALLCIVLVTVLAFGQAIVRGLYVSVSSEANRSHLDWHAGESELDDDQHEPSVEASSAAPPYAPTPK